MSEYLIFTVTDGLLLALSPACGALGGYVARHINLTELRKGLATASSPAGGFAERDQQFATLRDQLGPNPTLVGGVLGLVIALYFVGAITEHTTSLARILGLCILLGYQAPNLWRVQEKLLGSMVEEKLRTVLSRQRLETTTPTTNGIEPGASESRKSPGDSDA